MLFKWLDNGKRAPDSAHLLKAVNVFVEARFKPLKLVKKYPH
jgi:hypothetical protein